MWKGFLICFVCILAGCKHTIKVETKTPLITVRVAYSQGE